MSVIDQAKKEYDAAKAKGDKAGMDAAHAKADAARGYATYTTVKDGKYVQTRAGTERNTNSQPSWLNTPVNSLQAGGATLANDYYERLLSDQRSVIDERSRAQEEAMRRQIQGTIDGINANIPKINQDYETQQRANYITNERAKVGMGDYLSAAGYTGGMAESTALGLQANYQNLRNTTDQEKNNALMELQNMVTQAQATGDTNLANLAAQKYQSMLSAMQSARQSADSMAQWQQSMAMQNQQYADSQAQQAWENQFAEKGFAWEQEQAAIANALRQAKETRISSGAPSARRVQTEPMAYPDEALQTPAQQPAGSSLGDFSNSLMSRGLNSTSSVAVNNIIAAYQSGKMTREEANKRLAPLGVQI